MNYPIIKSKNHFILYLLDLYSTTSKKIKCADIIFIKPTPIFPFFFLSFFLKVIKWVFYGNHIKPFYKNKRVVHSLALIKKNELNNNFFEVEKNDFQGYKKRYKEKI